MFLPVFKLRLHLLPLHQVHDCLSVVVIHNRLPLLRHFLEHSPWLSLVLNHDFGLLIDRPFLVTLIHIRLRPSLGVIIRLEQLDEGVVGHILLPVVEAFSLQLQVV